MSEKTARKIRRRIRLRPGDAVQNAEIQLIQHLRNRKNIVICARNPDCAVVLQMRAAGRKPFSIELIVLFKALRFIPVALVHAHLLSGLHGNCSRAFPSLRSGRAIRGSAIAPFLRYASERLCATTIPNAVSFFIIIQTHSKNI